uniref:MCF.2 cell line derived transforming sequence n=1 Tax=Crocodylus porosus TaxID=8502 RepID=A0A7M4EQ47_CROPO
AKDISDDLLKEFAFLSGGRGKDNGWIITFPENSQFNKVSEEVFTKVLTYLTSVPSQHESDTKFILILDRRLDTWTSIKMTLQRIAASFPGNLHLVMVLRPTGFFQRTFTDIGFRFSQEDFLLKLPVVMLSSVSDLLTYIDERQLTPEFGGTLEYCHSEWVIFRTAIESFALTVKDIAQMLQSFGTELAETELPDDVYSIEHILALRTEKYCQLKVGLSGNAQSLLPRQVELLRLLAQLHEMETAFDGFWEKHQLKMEQYLQLWKFEQSFQEVKNAIEFLMDRQADLPDTGDSVSQVKERLKDLGSLDDMAQIGKAQVIILHGHQLAASHHYALNLICQQCNELRHLSDVVSDELKRKHARLQKTLELHIRLQQALQCCDEGAYLLANQQMDKCQSKEGAQKALQDIEKFLESSSLYLNYDPQTFQIHSCQIKLENVRSMFENRQACFKKLLDKHVRPVQLVAPRPENPPRSKSPLFSPKHGKIFQSFWSLKMFIFLLRVIKRVTMDTFCILQGYRSEMDNPDMIILMPAVLRNRKDILFGNMPEIYDFHHKIFLHSVENCLGAPERVGFCFLERREDFQMYEKYCQNKPRSEALWRQCSESTFFQECQRKLEHKLGLDSYLLKPVQRLTKYQLLLKELLKYSTSCDGVQELQEALVAMLDLLKSVNDSMHQISITGYEGDLSELGKVLMQGSFSVWVGHRKGPTKMKDLARFKPMQRHLFLYEKALVFCKKREEHGDGYDKTSSYSFKHFLKMNAVGITENVKGDHRKFEIWYSGREEVYVVQVCHFKVQCITVFFSTVLKLVLHQPTENGLSLCEVGVWAGWPGMSQSVEICEGLEDWSCNSYLSNCSDTEEEDGSQLVSNELQDILSHATLKSL